MARRTFFLKVGSEPARGPLDESAIRDGMRSGVVPDSALVGPTAAGPFEPAHVLLVAQVRSRHRFLRVFLGALVAVAVLGGGAAGIRAYLRSRPPALCPATPKVLAALKNTLEIDAYVTHGLPKLDAFDRDLEKLLRAYKAASKGRMDFKIIEAVTDEQKKAAKEAGLIEQPFASSEGEGTAQIHSGFLGLVFAYGAEKDSIKTLSPETGGLEFWINNKIREIRARADGIRYSIGMPSGDGEIKLSEPNLVSRSSGATPSLQGIVNQYFPFYTLKDVQLDQPLSPELSGVLLTQPERDLTDAELANLDAFVMGGRTLAIFAGAVNVAAGDAKMHPTLATHGLEKLLAGYGITLHDDVVMDAGNPYSVMVSTLSRGGEALKSFAIPSIEADDGHDPPGGLDARAPVFFKLEKVAFPFSSSLDIDKTKQPLATIRVLARTSSQSSGLTAPPASLSPLAKWTPGAATGSIIVAASVEGTITSAFGRGRSTAPARVLVVASSQFFANPFVRAATATTSATPKNSLASPAPGVDDESMTMLAAPYAQQELTSTVLVLKNTLDWLSMDDELGQCLPAPSSTTERPRGEKKK